MTRVKTAALTLAALTALTAALNLVHGSITTAGQDGNGVTSPRTVVQAAPSAPLCPFPLARCAPEPPEPATRLKVAVPEEPKIDVANEYSAAWEGVK